MNKLVIIDYGVGNLYSLQQACSAVGLDTLITNKKKEIFNARGVILPGVGAFGNAMEHLNRLDIVDEIRLFAKSGKTLLGLCLGMQLLMKKSSEFGEHKGLNLIDGKIEHMKKYTKKNEKVKFPHIGWNTININENFIKDKMFEGLSKKFDVYFVHSFCLKSLKKDYILCETIYKNINFCSAIKKDNIVGFQFHPEKSSRNGLKLLQNVFKN